MATTGAKYATSYLWKGTYWNGEYNLVGSDHSDSSYGYVMNTNSITAAEILLAGFDFSSLPSNAVITGYTLRTRGRKYSSGTSYTTRIFYQLAGDPVATKTTEGTYTGLGNYIYFVNGILTNTNYSDYSHTSDSNDSAVISWMNSNINKLKNGSFGVSFNAVNARIPYVSLELTYETPYSISTGVSPAGSGSVSGGGSYISGSSATLTASPSTGYHFVQWQDGNTNASRTITVSGDATYTAYFAINSYTVSTAVSPSGGGSVSGGGSYNHGDTATLTASPATGYQFVRWSDNVTSASRSFTVTGAATYTAIFELLSYSVSLSVSPSGSGSVSGAGTYPYGSTAILTAAPGTGYEFVAWSDGNTSAQRSFVVTSAVSLTAIFQRITYTIYLRDEDDNSLGSVTAQYGSSPQITTTPTKAPSGGYIYTFREWNTQRDGTGTSYPLNGLPAAYASATYYALFDAAPDEPPIQSITLNPSTVTSGQGVVITVTF